MKVYVLHYSYYEESEVRGVYTEDAMNKELAQYANWGREHNNRTIDEYEKKIETLAEQRKALGQEDRKLSERQSQMEADGIANAKKQLKGERKQLMKRMDELAHSIKMLEWKIKDLRVLTDDQLAEREMERNHLYFEEFYVLGME